MSVVMKMMELMMLMKTLMLYGTAADGAEEMGT